MSSVLSKAREVFKAYKGVKDSIEQEVDKLSAERDALQRERDRVFYAPRAKEDVIADLEGMLDIHRQEFARRLAVELTGPNSESGWARFNFHMQPESTEINMPRLPMFQLPRVKTIANISHSPGNHPVNSNCLMGMFADIIKPASREIIQAMDWPTGAISKQEREAKLVELDGKIKGVSEKLTALLKEAEEAGIQF